MLKRIFPLMLVFLFGAFPISSAKSLAPVAGSSAEFVPHELLVKFKAGTPAYVRAEIHRGAAATVLARFGADARLEHVRLPDGEDLDAALAYYASRADVQYAQRNFVYHLMNTTPNDPLYSSQWALPAVNAPAAWDRTTGRFNVIVAVIDTGVDYTHPDLGLNIWTNPGEAGLLCLNGLDNDADGYVNDCRGWDFFDNTNDPMDFNGHGTEMAGVIGALGNDALGIAGANWNVQIMPLRFTDNSGNGSTAVAIQAIEYSIAHGATISNNSWGAPQGTGAFDTALLDAIKDAEAAGQLFITAAGNQSANNDTTPFYPCDFSKYDPVNNPNPPQNIICATSINQSGNLATSSNSGAQTVQLGAPGDNIESTLPNQGYGSGSGTSQAAAYVTGGAALLKGCKASLTSPTIKNILLASVQPNLALTGITTTGGVVDYQAAVKAASNPNAGACDSTATTSSPAANAGGSYSANFKNQPIQFDASKSTDSGGQLLLYFWSFGDGSFGVGARPTHTYAAKGTYTATLYVRDNQGVIATQNATVNIRPASGH